MSSEPHISVIFDSFYMLKNIRNCLREYLVVLMQRRTKSNGDI